MSTVRRLVGFFVQVERSDPFDPPGLDSAEPGEVEDVAALALEPVNQVVFRRGIDQRDVVIPVKLRGQKAQR